jgi:hypothetical protein
MNVREFLNEHQKTAIGVCAGVVVVVLLAVILRSGTESAASLPGEAYFSDDDGKTWFTAPADRIVPFDYGGKPAVKAVLFSTDGGKTKFIGYLERYSESARKTLQTSRDGTMVPLNELTAAANDVEVKAPGDAEWVKRSDPAAQKVLTVPGKPGATLVQ